MKSRVCILGYKVQFSKSAFFSYIFIVSIAIAGKRLSAQNQPLYVTQYNVEDGLRQSMVKNIIQDKQGLLWMTTGDGLHCFDGSIFQNWRVPPKEPFTQSDNMMRYLIEIENNKLLIASASSLCVFDKKTAVFQIIRRKEGMHPTILKNKINGLPIVCLSDKNLYLVNDTTLESIKIAYPNIDPEDLLFKGLNSLYLNDSVLAIQAGTHIIELNVGQSAFENKCFKAYCYKLDNHIHAMTESYDGEMPIIIGNKLYHYFGNGQTRFLKELPYNFSTPTMGVNADGSILISDNENNALYNYCDNKFSANDIFSIDTYSSKIKKETPYIINFFSDSDRNLWICTDGQGVFMQKSNQVRCQKANVGFVRCIEEFNGHVYSGTFKSGLWELNYDLSNQRRLLPNVFNAATDIYDLFNDQNGHLWVLTSSDIMVFDKHLEMVFKTQNKFNSGHFHFLGNDTILLSNSGILHFFNTKTFDTKSVFTEFGAVSTIVPMGDSYLMGNSFNLVLVNKKLFDNFKIFYTDISVLLNKPIKALIECKNEFWIATNSGIEVFTWDTIGKSLHFQKSFMTNECVYSLIPDHANRIWFSSNAGLGFVNRATSTIHNLGIQHNLQSLEFNSNAFLEATNGNFYFGGINGLNGISPKKVHFQQPSHSPVLIRLMVADTLYCSGIPNVKHIELSYSTASFSGTFSSLNFSAAKNQLYSVKLQGHDGSWSNPSKASDFNYQNLRHGTYELWVKSADEAQQWSSPFLLLSITVRPPLWLQWWFIALWVVILFLMTYILIKKIQDHKYRRVIERLERETELERERLRISRDLHDEMGAGLSLILLNVSQTKSMLHDKAKVERSFESIARNTKDLYDSMSNLVWLLKTENQSFESLKIRLREMASGLLEDSGIEYQIVIPDNSNTLKVKRDAGLHLLLMVRETVNNALKHAKASLIEFVVILSDKEMQITIADNGIGFLKEKTYASGNGLKNLAYRTNLLGGELTIYSAPEKGTSICIKFPNKNVFEK